MWDERDKNDSEKNDKVATKHNSGPAKSGPQTNVRVEVLK